MSHEELFLYSLFLTLLIEVPVVFLLARYLYKRYDNFNIIFTSIIASMLTLPYLWFLLPAYISDRVVYLLVGEVSVVIIEALIYYKFLKLKFSQAFILSLVANLASILGGLIIM